MIEETQPEKEQREIGEAAAVPPPPTPESTPETPSVTLEPKPETIPEIKPEIPQPEGKEPLTSELPKEEINPSEQPVVEEPSPPISSPPQSVIQSQPSTLGRIFAIIKEKIFARREKRLGKILEYLNQKGKITNK